MEAEPPFEQPKADYRTNKWFFTWNNPTLDGPQTREKLRALGAKIARFQLEKAPSTGTLHMQGGAVFKSKVRWSTLRANFPGIWAQKLKDDSLEYGMKEDTRQDGPWAIGDIPVTRELRTGLEGHDLKPWQAEVIALASTTPTDSRSVNWVWSSEGGLGKTSVVKHLVDHCHALVVDGTNSGSVASAIADWVTPEKGEPKQLDVVILDIPRSDIGKLDYKVLEMIKDELVTNTKYRVRQVRFPTVHLFVFANQPPAELLLSADRWKIIEIS